MIKQLARMELQSVITAFSVAVIFISMVPLSVHAENVNEIQYSGTLIVLPCTVEPASESFEVDFGNNINTNDLANGQRHYSQEDIIFKLTDCDTTIGNTISAKFSGVSTTANGLLNVDAGSEASGIAIGLETPGGVPLPINNLQVKPVVSIVDGDMIIRLRSYLQTVDITASAPIETGYFSATLTYSLNYQ